MNYTTKDFSPIQPPGVNPKFPGYYVTTAKDYFLTHQYRKDYWFLSAHNGTYEPVFPLDFWDGEFWRAGKNAACFRHEVYWFGLNADPHKK